MHLTIGICDDSTEQVSLLIRYLRDFPSSEPFEFVQETHPERFLRALEDNPPQLVFLDIDMGDMNGIRLGEIIRDLYPDTVIVYITAYAEYACDAFGVRAFHYLLKPLTKETFDQVLKDALEYLERQYLSRPAKTWTIQTKNEIVTLRCEDIYYFEKTGHRIRVHTAKNDFYYYGSFVALLEKIDRQSFVQCHQGYVANIGKIRAFRDKMLFLEGEGKLPVSRTFTKQVREVLTEHLFYGKEQPR